MNKPFHGQKLTLLAMSVLAALTMPVYAAEEAVNTRDVVVTATRTEQEIKETPSAVEVITREDLDKIGANNLADALKMATSINVGSPAMAGSDVTVRGMSTRHTLIMVNGKRLVSEGSYSTANSYELERINMENVERIEIVRGPVSSLYGSDALGGVINIITRKPEKEQFTFSLSPQRYTDKSSIGSDNYAMRYDTGKSGKWSWIISADRTETDAYENADNTTKNQFGRRENLNMEGTYDLAGDQYLDVSVNLLREDLNGRSTETSGALRNDDYVNTRDQYSLGFRGKTSNGDYQIRTYYGEHDKTNKGFLLADGSLADFDVSKRKTWTLEGHVSTQIGDRHLLTTGGEYRTEKYRGTRIGTNDKVFDITYGNLTKQGSQADIDYSAFYVQDEWLVNDRLLIIPSVRYDDSNKFSGSASPKVGMTYKMNDHYRLKLNVGKGFKAPTLDDMYMEMTKIMGGMTVHVTGNPDLKPEKSTSYELGIEGEKGATFGKLTYFVNDVTDLISTKTKVSFIPGVGMRADSTYLNEDKADIDGVEFEIGRHLSDKITLKMNYTYLDATGTSGQRLEGRAKQQGTVQLHYDDSKENGISAVLWNEWKKDYLYSSSSKINKTYALWNISVNKKWNDNFSSYVGVENIFNKKDIELNLLGAILQAGMTFKL
ncbi:TonB-dependent receptor|uniref:Outer membrane receptor for ferrienterochelin and colicins n=1 Tax=Dendrosporobacter quercicolus TaxID=146817 RepID=A0A1G9SZP1_9FIRM|nr:TonB-dependent receptor [Dendrosporobacter quercicolus]NSL48566.1 TonB-dependent receptor [Dendrosporobacter quercicolus DSM 1736]SDM40862.1 outer membrane receptor for ferrienterochelin and colicins [Dendrosporobacter quercicolus]